MSDLMKFRCCVYDDELDSAPIVEHLNARSAAQEYVETNMANLDYPTEIELFVRHDDSGEVTKWNVKVTMIPDAYATPA